MKLFITLSLIVSSFMIQDKNSIHDFKIEGLNSSEEIDFRAFKGKKILIVNVASKCGYTPQYKGLQELYETYQEDLVIVGFPCNQFLMQESGSEDKIARFCSINYGVTFPMTTKIKVKGRKQHEIYKWLTTKELNNHGDYKISWNFNKFLLDEKGQIIEYYGSKVSPLDEAITKHLK